MATGVHNFIGVEPVQPGAGFYSGSEGAASPAVVHPDGEDGLEGEFDGPIRGS